MNEIEQAEQQRDIEILRGMIPSLQGAKLEPFVPPADSDVKPPEWGKAIMPVRERKTGDDDGGGVLPGATKVICAVQSGSTYIPKLMTPVQGTLFEDP